MTEIPEHLRKRAEEARAAKAAAESAPPATDSSADEGDSAEELSEAQKAAASKIPAHLLERSKAAKAQQAGGSSGGGGGTAVATKPAETAAAADSNGGPVPTGPGGHTQRLLTVVKSGSIQDVRATPLDKVHVWPHLLLIEFVAALAITVFLLIFSVFVNAPLLELANFNLTPNPSKAPWYFLGLQEMLKWFHPMVAGVMLPTIGLVGLVFAPYMDRNPSKKPHDRKFVIALFTLFLMASAIITIVGSFFRGPGFNFVFPWNAGVFFEL